MVGVFVYLHRQGVYFAHHSAISLTFIYETLLRTRGTVASPTLRGGYEPPYGDIPQ